MRFLNFPFSVYIPTREPLMLTIKQIVDASKWLEDNHGPGHMDGTMDPTVDWYYNSGEFFFKDEKLAVEFKLRFG